jgi:hypothetical protein
MTLAWISQTWQRWWFSIVMMLAYVGLFLFWKLLPSRWTFVTGALVVALSLAVAMAVAYKRGYFGGFGDMLLHALVIADILLEGFALEAVLPLVRSDLDVPTLVARYHDSSGFFLCAATFALIIGVGHYFSLRRRK